MSRPAIAPDIRQPAQRQPRHRPRRYPLVRRDPRRFARGRSMLMVTPPPPAPVRSENWRYFAHSFGGAFLFVSLLIA